MEQEPDFEGDRVVIREAEEAKAQKQGWFSKRKKTSVASTAPSRPPSATSFGSSRRKTLSKSQEDDLPPRMDAATTPLPGTGTDDTPTPPERRSSDPAPEIPVHAGFDLAAINHMIGEAARHPEQLVVPQPKPDQAGSVLPHTLHNSIPAPPLSPPISHVETVTGAVDSVPDDDVGVVGTSSRKLPGALSATFTTSLTLRDRDPYRSRAGEVRLCSESANVLSRPTYPPEMNPPVWPSAKGNSFAGPTEGGGFGSGTRSRDRLGALGAQSAAANSPGLSFGSPDGTITFQGLEPDPWGASAELRHGTGMNPWSV